MTPDVVSAAEPLSPARASEDSRLAKSAGLTGGATLVSRVLGLVRDQVLASLFGAGNEMDAFVVAFRIPNLVRDLFAEGAMSAAFVPTFTRHLTLGGKPDAWRLGNNVLNALLVVTGIVVLLAGVGARPLVQSLAPHFADVAGKIELTVRLTRMLLPFLTLVAIAAAAMGMLNSLHHYFLPALSPAMFNTATIVCAVVLVPLMPRIGEPRIMAIAIGALIGGAGQVALQWPSLRREGFRYAPVLDARDPGLLQVLLLMGPGTIGLAATQVNLFVNTLLATSQGIGAVSWMTYAFRLMYLPIGLFGVSIGTAVLPAVSRHAAIHNTAGIRQTVSRGLGLMLMLNVPATVGLLVLATPIVQLLFEHVRFQPSDTIATASAVRFYSLGLVGYSAVRIASPTFYAIGRSRIPVMVSGAAIVINAVASLVLVRWLGFSGLALGTSIAAVANAALLVWLLSGRLDGLELPRLSLTFGKVVLSTAVMAAAVLVIQAGMQRALPGSHLASQAVRLVVSISGGLVALAAAATLLAIDEFDEVVETIGRELRKLRV
ncbi:MAG TPA: murein biosynthesis integral membrane protein MurJ [Vicinamibacterales bacterium]